ncbi:hypothetical protein ABUW04_13135 [Streptacidiphilus sp. N1-10]|uniref:Uncharacterized protein n=1 Tax=Streptacidiphilus jeojiensis TaxID=3229225 RepID=A0ABV6XLQ6_9ACTN
MLLTLDRLHWLRESPLSTGYWCEALAYSLHDSRSFWLGSTSTPTPRLALRWLRHRTQHVLDQLDAAATRPAHEWLRDSAEHEQALFALARGEMYTLSICEDTTRYILSARPTRSTQ